MDRSRPPEALPGGARERGGVGTPPLIGNDRRSEQGKGKGDFLERGEPFSLETALGFFFCVMGYFHE